MLRILMRISGKILRMSLAIIFRPKRFGELARLGSVYGGWHVPLDRISESSICYSFGAGEDVTFDLELARCAGCNIHLFDPTPRSKAHFEKLMSWHRSGERSSESKFDVYRPSSIPWMDKLEHHTFGIWTSDEVVQFYEPRDSAHVSHSIVNLQGTHSGFDARVKRLDTIMESLGHAELDVLKIDIEGAEYDVIRSLVNSSIRPKVLCVDFDQAAKDGWVGLLQLSRSINGLARAGYAVTKIENWDFVFLKT